MVVPRVARPKRFCGEFERLKMSTDVRVIIAAQQAAVKKNAIAAWTASKSVITAEIFEAWLAKQNDASMWAAYANGVFITFPIAAGVIPAAYQPTTDRNRSKILLHDVIYAPATTASVSLTGYGKNQQFVAQLRAKLVALGYADNVNQLDAARQSGSLFGGIFNGVVNAFKPIVHASLQVSTLGNADQAIHAAQTVVRNPIVQAVAISALTVYTGGAAAGLMGGGLAGTVGGSIVANAAIAKATDRTFNLQNAMIQGVTAGAGAAVKSAEIVANTAVNGAAQAALTKAISDKAAGRAFNLQNTLIAGAGGLSNPVAFNLTVGDIVTGAKQVNELKTAYTNFEDSKAKAKEQSAAIAQQTAQINAEAARIAAAQAELKALQAAIANAKPAPIVAAIHAPAVVAQAVVKPPAAKAGMTTAEKIAAAGLAVGVLRLLTA
jgi:hypothetical protein